MEIQFIYAAMAVKDLKAAEDWYAKVIDRPADDHPMETLVQWRGWSTAGIQLFKDDGGRAGHGRMTLVTPDMNAARDRLADAGVTLGEISQGDYGRIAQLTDPDGNRITLAEPPKR